MYVPIAVLVLWLVLALIFAGFIGVMCYWRGSDKEFYKNIMDQYKE